MPTRVIVAAATGALIGALVWGAISYLTNYEIGYIAWGIGLLVGGLARAVGASGERAALLCAALALVSIVGGKVLAIHWSMDGQIREEVEFFLTRDYYEEIVRDAEGFAQVEGPQEHAAFMVDHRYTDAPDARAVTGAELAWFREEVVPGLEEFHRDRPSFQRWRDQEVEQAVATVRAESSPVELMTENLGLLDIVFGLLGVATAFQIVMAAPEPQRPGRRPRRTATRPTAEGPASSRPVPPRSPGDRPVPPRPVDPPSSEEPPPPPRDEPHA